MSCDFCLNWPSRAAELIRLDSPCLWSTLGPERGWLLGSVPPSCHLLRGHPGTSQILLQRRVYSGVSIS